MKKFSEYLEKELLVGGQGDNMKDSEFDQEELEKGIREEMKEHGMSYKMAKETAKDHLSKDRHYYSNMEKFEKQEKLESSNEEINGEISSGDFKGVALRATPLKGVALPLVGLIRRPYGNALMGGMKSSPIAKTAKAKHKKKKFKNLANEDVGMIASIGPSGQPSIQKHFIQPTVVSVKSMTKVGFKQAQKPKKKMFIKMDKLKK